MSFKETHEEVRRNDEVDLADLCYCMYRESLFVLVVAVVGLILGLSVMIWWALA